MNRSPIMFHCDDAVANSHLHAPISVFKRPETDIEYDELEELLDKIIDIVREDEDHPLAIAMQIIGDNLEEYDSEMHDEIGHGVTDIEMVEYLMQRHSLLQKDLASIFGGQANVSKFLNGKKNYRIVR